MKKTWIIAALSLSLSLGGSFACQAEAQDAGADETALTAENVLGAVSSLFGEGGSLNFVFEEGGPVDQFFAEGGLGEQLLGEGGALNGVIPEGMDVEGLVRGLGSQLGDENSSLYQIAGSVIGSATKEDGSLDLGSLLDMAKLFAGGSGEDAAAEVSDKTEDYNAAIRDYIFSENEGIIESGDVQLLAATWTGVKEGEEDVKLLGYFLQTNYAADGADLKLVGGSGEDILFTLAPNEEGGYYVADAVKAEEGEGYAASMEKLCQEVDVPFEAQDNTELFRGYSEIMEILRFLDENPEYQRVEYMGELKTREELEAKSEELLGEVFSVIFAGLEDMADEIEAEAEPEAEPEVTP